MRFSSARTSALATNSSSIPTASFPPSVIRRVQPKSRLVSLEFMDQSNQWDQWLAEADSIRPLAPEGYDDDAAKVRMRSLWLWLANALATYEVRPGS